MIYQINPLHDQRWESLVQRHPDSSVFHSTGWLKALWQTYGYKPVVYTTCPPGKELTNGLVLCRVSSWLTGERLVSLPFSDHCDALMDRGNNESDVYDELRKEYESRKLKAIELRPRNRFPDPQSGVAPHKTYCFHSLDLNHEENELFSAFHKDCIQRKIQRAERESLTYRVGCSNELLNLFYGLFVRSRRRQGIPPPPFRWFQNLAACLGSAMQIRVALYGNHPVASIVTLKFRNALVYKYGCSDPQLNKLGGIPWLFWKAIQEARRLRLHELDLGRSDWNNPGLITFKDRLGAKRSSLNYWQYSKKVSQPYPSAALHRPGEWIWGHLPLPILIVAGRILYRHFG
ncbi:MAG TPA: GNAT family N-acetyltransferase [Terriglobia bacterium]|jgi:hypothetical protein|nr:GNAT family N-acetyltransferase [Terriglobia bacterium]